MPFQSAQVRIIQTEIGPAIPAGDIATALGCSRKNITNIIGSNPHLFKGVTITSTLSTNGGPQKTVFLTRDAVIGILMRVHPSGSKSEEGKKRIETFQAWARDTLSKEMQIQTTLTQTQQAYKAWADTAGEHIRFARTIARETGRDENMCLAIAIQQAEKETGINLSMYRKLIGPASAPRQEISMPETQIAAGVLEHIKVSEIAGIMRMRAEEINRYLEKCGYQVRDPNNPGEFLLTEKGAKFGKVFPYAANSGHIGYFLKWQRAVIADSKMRENRPRGSGINLFLKFLE